MYDFDVPIARDEPYCEKCDYDTHVCPTCGAPTLHIQIQCEDCIKENED